MHRIGPFRVLDRLGQGGMAMVVRAENETTREQVAIKFLCGDQITAQGVELLHREARAIASLNHPHTVQILDYGVLSGTAAAGLSELVEVPVLAGSPFVAMELAERIVDLSLDAQNWPKARTLLRDILSALAHAHARGFIHRDIKPANLLMVRDGHQLVPRLTDFGIVMTVTDFESRAFETHDHAGTVDYMAPEQFLDWRDAGPWTDLYAVGCLTHEIITGRLPFQGPAMKIAVDKCSRAAPPLDACLLHVPAGLQEWLNGLLARHPGDRFQSAAAAKAALNALGEAVPGTGTAPQVAAADGDKSTGITATTLSPVATLISAPTPAQADGPTQIEAQSALAHGTAPLTPTWRPMTIGHRKSRPALFDLRPAPFVGRHRERDLLWQTLRKAHEHQSVQVVIVRGLSGHGKSRLCTWLTATAHEQGGLPALRAAWGSVPARGMGLSGLGRTIVGARELAFEALVQRLEYLVGSQGGDANVRMVDLSGLAAELLDFDQPVPDGVRFHSEARRLQSYCALLQAASRGSTLLLHLDDIHRDAEAPALIEALAKRQQPMLIVATAREDEGNTEAIEALARGEHRDAIHELQVDALDDGVHRELVQELFPLAPNVVDRIAAATLGNPFFAIQVVGDWLHRGLLVPGQAASDAPWEMSYDASVELPKSVSEIVLARLDDLMTSLPGATTAHVELLATLGEEVDLDEWLRAAALMGDTPPPSLIDRLERQGVGRPDRDSGAFVFAHAMVRDAILQRCAREGRACQLHQTCASMLQAAYRPHVRNLAARLAAHLEQAGRSDDAARAYLTAAQEVAELGNSSHVLTLIRHFERLRDPEGYDICDAQAALTKAGALATMNHMDEASQLLHETEARVRAEQVDEILPEVMRSRAIYTRLAGKHASACQLMEAVAAEYVRRADHKGAGLANLGTVVSYRFLGDGARALSRCDRALHHFEQLPDPFWIVTARRERARLLLHLGRLDEVEDLAILYEEARAAGAIQISSNILSDRGRLARLRGDLGAAMDFHQRARELMFAQGDVNAATPLAAQAAIAIRLGDYREARRLLSIFASEASELIRGIIPETSLYQIIVDVRRGPASQPLAVLVETAHRHMEKYSISNDDVISAARAAARVLREAHHSELADRCQAIYEDHLRRRSKLDNSQAPLPLLPEE